MHSKEGVTGEAYLAIKAIKAGSVTLKLTVNDGLGAMDTFDIPVMVKAANAPPALKSSAWTAAKFNELSRVGAMRLTVDGGDVTVMIPADAFTDPDGDMLIYEAQIGDAGAPTDLDTHKGLLGATISTDGTMLTFMPKMGGANTVPVIIKATDPYGQSVMTGNENTVPDGTNDAIRVEVNIPPQHKTYINTNSELQSTLDAPAGRMGSDKAVLADLTIKRFSIVTTTASTATLLTLSNHFVDLDSEDNLEDDNVNNGLCTFMTSSSDYATVAFNGGRTAITIVGKKVGTFDLTVTCTDTKEESITDSVTLEIVG